MAAYEDAEERGVFGKWIPVSERLPEDPKENEIFDNKPLELYLVSIKGDPYPFRAFWNGKFFTNGWQKCDVTAWMPLPEPYQVGAKNAHTKKPQTNADWIRSMTDEELTAILCNITSNDEACDSCLAWKYCHKGHTGFEDWLKEESEEN